MGHRRHHRHSSIGRDDLRAMRWTSALKAFHRESDENIIRIHGITIHLHNHRPPSPRPSFVLVIELYYNFLSSFVRWVIRGICHRCLCLVVRLVALYHPQPQLVRVYSGVEWWSWSNTVELVFSPPILATSLWGMRAEAGGQRIDFESP